MSKGKHNRKQTKHDPNKIHIDFYEFINIETNKAINNIKVNSAREITCAHLPIQSIQTMY